VFFLRAEADLGISGGRAILEIWGFGL